MIEGEAVALEEEEEGDKRKTKMSGDAIYDVDSNPNFSSYCKLIFVIVTFHETFWFPRTCLRILIDIIDLVLLIIFLYYARLYSN